MRDRLPSLPTYGLAMVLCCVGSCGDTPDGVNNHRKEPDVVSPVVAPLPPPQPLPPELKAVYRTILSRRYAEARRVAEAYLRKHPDSAAANLMIGLSYFKADNHGAARPYLEASLALAPGDYIAHDFLGEALFLLGELEGARSNYEALRRFIPDDPKPLVRLGIIDQEEDQVEAARGHFLEALRLFEKLRQRDPRRYEGQKQELASLHARRAELAFAEADYASARTELETATQLWPGNISAYFTLSLVYRRLGKESLADETLRHYESALGQRMQHQGQPK